MLGPEIIQVIIVGITQSQASYELVVFRDLELRINGPTPRGQRAQSTGIYAARLSRHNDRLQQNTHIHSRKRQHALMHKKPQHRRGVKELKIAAALLIARIHVIARNTQMRLHLRTHRNRPGLKIIRVRTQSLIIAVGQTLFRQNCF